MKIQPTRLLIIGLFLFASNFSFAQFTLQGEIRPRGEVRNGFKQLPTENTSTAFHISQRTRLTLNYTTEKIATKISFQDARIWGDEAYKKDAANIGIHEAWAEMSLCDSLSLRLGKQELNYDNGRLLTNSNWTQLAVAHNAALLKYKKNGLWIDVISAFNQNTENTFGTNYYSDSAIAASTYKNLNIVYISKQLTSNFKLSLLGIADGYQKYQTKNTTYFRGTFGGTAEYKKEKKYAAAVRGFYQMGKLSTGQEIAAYYGSIDLSYYLNKLSITAGMEYISGNDAKDADNKKSNAFNILYGSGHGFNGNMEYFITMMKKKDHPGLINPYAILIYKLKDNFQLRADFHYFMLQNNYLVNNDVLDKNLGIEGDFSCKYDINKEVSLSLGFSAIKGEKSLETIVTGDSNYWGTWGFAMLTFKPTFFKSEKK